MKEYKIPVAAGGVNAITVRGNFFRLLNPGGASVRIDVNDLQFYLDKGQAVKNLPFIFETLHIYNEGASDIEVVLMVGVGEFDDNSMTGSFRDEANSTLITPVMMGFSALQVLSIPANPNRVKLCVRANTGNADVVWVGGMINYGIPLLPGDVWEEKTTCAVDFKCGAGGSAILYWYEVE